MEKDYGRVLKTGDIIELQQFPRGPTAILVIKWVYYVVVIAAAIYALTMPEPGLPNTADVKEGSPTYSISARGNRYRPERKGPVLYGKLRIVPDFDQPPFSTYDTNNDQTLHMIFRITQGSATVDISSISFEDTPLSNFSGVSTEVTLPGEVPTLFPVGVVQSNDINNVELEGGLTSAYVANDIGTQISKIAVDMSSPGIAEQNKKNGNLLHYKVAFSVQAQEIDDSNAPVGDWVTLGERALAGSSNDAIRRTFEFPVDPGRYQVRLQRITPKNDSQYVHDTVTWAALKGYLHDPDNTSINTRLAISVRASEQIGNRALTDMSVIATRRLPQWDPVDGWGTETETKSIGWALADLCRASYAGDRSDLHYDLERLYELDQQLTPLGHEFNAYFDTEGVSVWEALVKAGTPGRITPIDKGGFYTFVRDEIQPSTVQAFTMRNIQKGSFRIEYSGVLEETADSIIVKFQDEDNNYRVRELTCSLPDSPAQNPRIVDLFGVTNATRAKELGMFFAASNRYRRKLTPLSTGIEGRIPFYGAKIAISHFLLGEEGTTQVSGDIVAFDGINRIKVSEPIRANDYTDPYIVMIDLDGEPMPAYPITIIDPFTLQVGGSPDWSQIQIEPNYKRPMFIVGEGTEYVTESKVIKIERNGSNIRIDSFVDDPRVYQYGDGVIPPDPVDIPPPQTAAPILTELTAHVGGTVEEPVVTLNWSLQNADRTDIEFSDDGGATFVPLDAGFTLNNYYTHRPIPGEYVYRVAAVNLFRGPWVPITVDTSAVVFNPPLAPTNLSLREPFIGPTLKVQWDSDSFRHYIEIRVGGVALYTTVIEGEEWDFDGSLAQQFNIGRSFTVRVYAVGENNKTSVGFVELAVSNPAPAQLDNLTVTPFLGQASITFDWPVDPDIEGISVWKSNTSGFTPNEANLNINRSRDPVLAVPVAEAEVAYIRIGAVDAWGLDTSSISGQFTVTGKSVDTAAIQAELDALSEDLDNLEVELNNAEADILTLDGKFPVGTTDIQDNAITTPKLVTNSVTTEKILALAITADKIAALAILTDKLAANAVSADKIAANAVTADKIQALAVTAAKIAANTITADKMNIATLSAITANMGTVTAGTFQTTSGTTPRVVISSSGSFPIWMGNGSVNATNAKFYFDTAGNAYFKGTLQVTSATSGERLEITNNVIRVYDASGVLRVKLGDLS